jgi:uncharacterized protein (TIGR00725 family)
LLLDRSSRCGPDADEYKKALKLGRLLIEAGFDVASGGYAGVMEAISRGAHEATGEVIGVTMEQFKSAPNPYLNRYEMGAPHSPRSRACVS